MVEVEKSKSKGNVHFLEGGRYQPSLTLLVCHSGIRMLNKVQPRVGVGCGGGARYLGETCFLCRWREGLGGLAFKADGDFQRQNPPSPVTMRDTNRRKARYRALKVSRGSQSFLICVFG